MSFLSIAIGASAVIGAAGQIYAGKQQKAAADYNAKIQEQQAEMEFLEQQEQTKRDRANNEKLLARNIALRAASGIDIQSGSSLLLEAESAASMELEILDNQRVSETRSRRLRSGARVTRLEGKAAQTTSYFQAGASLLRGATSIASNIKRSKRTTKVTFGALRGAPTKSTPFKATIGPLSGAPVRNP